MHAAAVVILGILGAEFSQPSGAAVPTPLSCDAGRPAGLAAIFACTCTTAGTCNIGAPCPGGGPTSCDPGTNGTCETTLWHDYSDNSCLPNHRSGLEPATDAVVTTGAFTPKGPLKLTLQTRGSGTFQDVLAWYNAGGSAPTAASLHPVFACEAAPGATVTVDLATDPAYAGGPIGFALVTPQASTTSAACAGGDCCASLARLAEGTGFAMPSEPELLPDAAVAPWIHLLVYPSRIAADEVELAWDGTYAASSLNFTDLVVRAGPLAPCTAGVACPGLQPGGGDHDGGGTGGDTGGGSTGGDTGGGSTGGDTGGGGTGGGTGGGGGGCATGGFASALAAALAALAIAGLRLRRRRAVR